MLVFKSLATGALFYHDDVGMRILKLWGKQPAVPGILSADKIPQAMAALIIDADREAIEIEQKKIEALTRGETYAAAGHIPFRTRIAPLLKVLDTCMKEEADLTW